MNTPTGGVTLPESRFDALAAGIKGCGDKSCLIERPTGMATNGGCRCYRDPVKMQRLIAAFNEAKNTRAALAGEWRDIASAPRDGTRVLLWNGEYFSAGAYCDYDSLGWLMDAYDYSRDRTGPWPPDPTHWMPAAPLPKEPGR